MIAITITAAGYKALKAMRPETSQAPPAGTDGMIRIWIDRKFVDRLSQMRSLRESYSDVIIRMAKADS